MVQALIPRVLDGQQGRREARGIIQYGDVVSVRVEGNVNDAAAFTGDGIPARQRRSMYADVNVLGRGGRVHPIPNCACLVPVKVGDPVIIEMPHGNPTRGCFVVGLQVPRRPLMYQSPTNIGATQQDLKSSLLDLAIPYEFLGWPQSFLFEFEGLARLDWVDSANWNAAAPATANLIVYVEIQRKDGDLWNRVDVLTSRSFVGEVEIAGLRQMRTHIAWAEVIDDADTAIVDGVSGAEALRLVVGVSAASGTVKWYDNVAGTWRESLYDLTVPLGYTFVAIEFGSGTY